MSAKVETAEMEEKMLHEAEAEEVEVRVGEALLELLQSAVKDSDQSFVVWVQLGAWDVPVDRHQPLPDIDQGAGLVKELREKLDINADWGGARGKERDHFHKVIQNRAIHHARWLREKKKGKGKGRWARIEMEKKNVEVVSATASEEQTEDERIQEAKRSKMKQEEARRSKKQEARDEARRIETENR